MAEDKTPNTPEEKKAAKKPAAKATPAEKKAKPAGDKPAAKKKEKPPAIEKKPFAEFVQTLLFTGFDRSV